MDQNINKIDKSMIFTHEINWDRIKTINDIKTLLKGLGLAVRPGNEGLTIPMEFLKKIETKQPPLPQKKNDKNKK